MITATVYSPYAGPRVYATSLAAAINMAAARNALSDQAMVFVFENDVYEATSMLNSAETAMSKDEVTGKLELRVILRGGLAVSPKAWLEIIYLRWDEEPGVSKGALACALNKLYGLNARAIQELTGINASTIRSALRRRSKVNKHAEYLAGAYVLYGLYHGHILATSLLGREYFK